MNKLPMVVAVALVAACGGAQKSAAPPVDKVLNPAQIAERSMPSIVHIKTNSQLGTGFIVWEDGRIVTNLHVIAGANAAEITLTDGRSFKDVQVLAADRQHDLAVLRIPAKKLPVLPLGYTTAVKPGERVVAIGHPLGLENTVSDGLVSAIRVLDPKFTVLQITAPIAPGSSGGPIFNDRGEVIGVATRYSAEGQNLNFGVPIIYLKPLLLAERAVPLASFAREIELGILEGCTGDEVKLAVEVISDAIKIGVPLYNGGNAQGCYDVYQAAALKILDKVKGCAGVRETLLGGLAGANHAQDASGKAWAVRRAFDNVLGAVDTVLRQSEQRQQPQRPKPNP
jgi:hypothetical protein